ncbi:RNA polymerase III-inhibiting protein maf1 [Stylosanthes scabra]|uniref:RNA polymerase III-inhibiting protein maf1 n=1 Tax=Stylosanthes scabra TaxID=79078 RepID=A0ABU6UP10_9FABA|nr:RNA polymerase III-inhibiting protein maf1 [Stylosanthes scabra]
MSDPEIAPATQSEPLQTSHDQHSNAAASKLGPGGISFSIWPPTQRTRDAVVNRLIETLSTPSVLSKRYGTMTSEEASAAARQIEDEAFAAAGGSAASDDDGIEILQVYSKEISKRMLDTVKARANTGASAVDNGGAQAPGSDVAPPPTAESAPAESET